MSVSGQRLSYQTEKLGIIPRFSPRVAQIIVVPSEQDCKYVENHTTEIRNLATVKELDKNIISSLCRVLKSFLQDHCAQKNLNAFLLSLDLIDRYKDTYQDSFMEQLIIQKNKQQDELYNVLKKTFSSNVMKSQKRKGRSSKVN